MPPVSKRRKGKQGTFHTSSSNSPKSTTDKSNNNLTASTAATTTITTTKNNNNDSLILTSARRRGVYECDACHTDISQAPRVRCAECADYDLCLDCLASPPPKHLTLHQHSYRVCTSTRFPLFGALRNEPVAVEGEDKEEDMQQDDNDGTDYGTATSTTTNTKKQLVVFQSEDRSSWTIEEDLRLLEGIEMHGLGNWTEIAEVVSGSKTPRRCMERYLDDFLGRYGHILPPYAMIREDTNTTNANTADATDNSNADDPTSAATATAAAVSSTTATPDNSILVTEDTPRASKRRAAFFRSPSVASATGSNNTTTTAATGARKRYRVVPTDESLVWPYPFLPQPTEVAAAPSAPRPQPQQGQFVNRDLATKAEQAYVRAAASCDTPAKLQALHTEWTRERLGQPGGPTVLPMRPDDVGTLPGAELIGFMPRRGDLDIEWENDAELAIADMEFLPNESPADVQLKLQVLEIYNRKLTERERRKKFILQRKLYLNYKPIAKDDSKDKQDQDLPCDERDLKNRMRIFERFHTVQEHERFLQDILKAKRLRKEIAKLQTYRRIGISTLAEAEKYELDKVRHEFHKTVHLQKLAEARKSANSSAATTSTTVAGEAASQESRGNKPPEPQSVSMWKQYRERKSRKSINRGQPAAPVPAGSQQQQQQQVEETKQAELAKKEEANNATDKDQGTAAPLSANGGDVASEDGATKADPSTTSEGAPGETAAAATTDKDVTDADDMDVDEPAAEESLVEEANGNDKEETTSTSKDDTPALAQAPGAMLLSKRELALCEKTKLLPLQYLEIKKVLIHHAVGLVDTNRRQQILVKIDTERRGQIIDFVVKAGWVSSTIGKDAKSVTV